MDDISLRYQNLGFDIMAINVATVMQAILCLEGFRAEKILLVCSGYTYALAQHT